MKTDLVVAGYIINEDKILLIHHKKLDLWLPVGGHIEENETPDDALLREIKEEVGLDVEILGKSELPVTGATKRALAIPFDVNVHNVGDHDHCALFYICKALNPENLKINKELKDFEWFTKDDLDKKHVTAEIKNQCLKAFEVYNK